MSGGSCLIKKAVTRSFGCTSPSLRGHVACSEFFWSLQAPPSTAHYFDGQSMLNDPVDKHCIGGIPGNRTSMVVIPSGAAHGLMISKTSSRAITSPAGTAGVEHSRGVTSCSETELTRGEAAVDDGGPDLQHPMGSLR